MSEEQSTGIETEAPETSVAETAESAEKELNAELEAVYDEHMGDTDGDTPKEKDDPAQTEPAAVSDNPAPEWFGEAAKEWGAVPESVRGVLAQREQQLADFVGQTQTERDFAATMEPIARVIANNRDFLSSLQDRSGRPMPVNPQTIAHEVQNLIALKKSAFSDPVSFLRDLSQMYEGMGIDLQSLLHGAAEQEKGWQDPELAKTRREIEELRQWKEQQEAQREAAERQAGYQQYVQGLSSGLEQVVNSVDEVGAPLYPHLKGEHAGDIGAFIGRFMRANSVDGNITAKLLKQAYEAAVYAHPAVRILELKRQEDKRAREWQGRTGKAKRAAGIIPPSGGSSGKEIESLSSELEDIFKKYSIE